MADAVPAELLTRWQTGDQQAAAELFRLYASRLIGLARSRLKSHLGRRIDPEDVVQSVYRSFFAQTRDEQFELQLGGDLWRLLVTITLRKLSNQLKHNLRHKRSADRDSHFGSEDSLMGLGTDAFVRAPTPLEAAALTDELQQALASVKPQYRPIVELRLQGYRIEEIAVQLNRGQRTVRRVLEQVKQALMASGQ